MWTAQRQLRPSGYYYSLVDRRGNDITRTVVVRSIPGDPPTTVLSFRLRRWDPECRWPDDLVRRVALAADDEVAARAICVEAVTSLRHTPGATITATQAQALLAGSALAPVPLVQRVRGAAAASAIAAADALASTIAPPPPRPIAVALAKPEIRESGVQLKDYVLETWWKVRGQQKTTWEREERWWGKHILPRIGHLRLCDLTREHWNEVLASMTKCGGRSKALAQVAYRCALKHAVKIGWLSELHKFDEITGSTKPTRPPVEPLDMAEVQRLLDATAMPRDRALFGVQWGLGLRPAEVLALSWSDVAWATGMVHVRGTKNERATAQIPLTPLARRELHAWWLRCGQPYEGPCFAAVGPRGAGIMTTYPRRALNDAVARAGLAAGRTRAVIPYSARHSFATNAAMMGVDRAATRRMMRHSSTSTVLERAYERASLAQTAAAFAKFGE